MNLWEGFMSVFLLGAVEMLAKLKDFPEIQSLCVSFQLRCTLIPYKCDFAAC